MKDKCVLHTLYADGAQPGVIHLDHDARPIIDEVIAKTKKYPIESWEKQCHMMYDQWADEFVGFILKHMPGGLVDAVFAKLAAHKAGLFVVPHAIKFEAHPAADLPSGRVERAWAIINEQCVDRDGNECLHPKQDYPHGICASLHCPRINGGDDRVEQMTNPTAPGGQQS